MNVKQLDPTKTVCTLTAQEYLHATYSADGKSSEIRYVAPATMEIGVHTGRNAYAGVMRPSISAGSL